MTKCVILTQIRIAVFGREDILPPYDNIPLYKLISYLKDVKLKSLEMRPFIEEFMANELPTRMPEWAKINDVEDSSDDELQADQRYAKECGDALLHRLLYQTSNQTIRTWKTRHLSVLELVRVAWGGCTAQGPLLEGNLHWKFNEGQITLLEG